MSDATRNLNERQTMVDRAKKMHAEGYSVSEIAVALNLSESVVRPYVDPADSTQEN